MVREGDGGCTDSQDHGGVDLTVGPFPGHTYGNLQSYRRTRSRTEKEVLKSGIQKGGLG